MILCSKIIGVYKKASGQLLNQAKTSLFCSKKTPLDIQEEFKTKFDAKVICQHEKYLGLPSLLGRSKHKTFLDLKEKLANKLVGWKEKLLSKASKEILIKVVAQTIPTYTMSCFKIPVLFVMKWLVWLGIIGGDRWVTRRKWLGIVGKNYVPKSEGGMGFKLPK